MNNIFMQPENFTRIYFDTYHSDIDVIDDAMPEEVIAVTMNEIKSQTVESMDNDLWRVEIFIDDQLRVDDILVTIRDLVNTKKLRIISEIKYEKFDHSSWEKNYEQKLPPIIIDNFYISLGDQKKDIPKDLIPIFIKSSRAFGTGDHETTSGCIKLINNLAPNQIKTALDIGTGTGVLSFVAQRIWPKAIISACDIDAKSLEVAEENSIYNDTRIDFFQNNEDNLLSSGNFLDNYDLIIANILQNPLIEMASSIKSISHENSKIILSGFLSNQSHSIEHEYAKYGWVMEDKISNNGWDAILLKVNTG